MYKYYKTIGNLISTGLFSRKELMEAYPNYLSREALFEKIWGTDQILESRTLDVHIKSLRNKLKDTSDSIETVYGVGYRFKK